MEIDNELQEEKKDAPRRGRPRKIDLPEVEEKDIISVEEVDEKDIPKDAVIEECVLVRENEGQLVIDNPEGVLDIITEKYHTAHYQHKKGEDVYLVHFSKDPKEGLFGNLVDSYSFRPYKTKIREVLINEDDTISYRVDGLPQNCFIEKLIAKTLEDCQKICDIKNAR